MSDAARYAPGVPQSDYGFQGNQDAYGVGIRAGYYTQAFTVWAANFFVPHEAPFLHSVNILFIFAMLAGLICMVSRGPSKVWAVEAWMLLNITYSVAWIGTCNPHVRESLPWEGTIKTGLVRQMSFLALDTFALWFWFFGLPKMKSTIGDLGTCVYFYARGDIHSGIRTANQIITILDIVYQLLDLSCRGAVTYQNRCLKRQATAASLKDTLTTSLDSFNDKSSTIKSCVMKRADSTPVSPPESPQLSHASTGFLVPTKIVSRSSKKADSGEKRTYYQPTLDELNRADEYLTLVLVTSRLRWYYNFVNFFTMPITAVPAVMHAMVRGYLCPRLLITVLQYINAQPDAQMHQFVYTLRNALKHPYTRKGKVDWRALAIMMRFRIALNPPPPAPRHMRIGEMMNTLGIGIVLAIGTELTIQWNYIRGVQQIDTVGQLIPLSLGVGGLLKVVWGAFEGDEEWCGKRCALERKLLRWRDAALLWTDANKHARLRQSHVHDKEIAAGV